MKSAIDSCSNKNQGRLFRSVSRKTMTFINTSEATCTIDAMKYFYEIYRKVFVNNELPFSADRPIIGIYCMMIPEEIIYAAGCIPVRLCGGSHDASIVGDAYSPRDLCPVAKASAGFTISHEFTVYDSCDAVIIPATCDHKRKLASLIADHTEVWLMNVPHTKDNESSRSSWNDEMFALTRNLEKLVKRKYGKTIKINGNKIQQSVSMLAKAHRQARKLYDLRKNPSALISGTEAAIVMGAYSFDDASQWTEAAEALNNQLQIKLEKADQPSSSPQIKRPRIFLAGCPSIFPNFRMLSLTEEMGGLIVADESCTGDRYLYDPVVCPEKTFNSAMTAIAARYIMPCVCPTFSPNHDRITKLKNTVTEFGIDGMIYYVLKGCVLYDFEFTAVEKAMKDIGVPIIRIESDYNPEDIEQMRTRIEAFIEMLSHKKER